MGMSVYEMYSHVCSDSMCGVSGEVQDEFVAGGGECVEFVLNYRTLDDHAIDTFLTVNINSSLLQGPENIISNPPVSKDVQHKTDNRWLFWAS